MLNTTIVPARSLQKSYKSIINFVQVKKQAVILTTNQKPQAALINLEDLEELKQAKARNAALDMLKIAQESREELNNLPADLRDRANTILYTH